MIQKSPQTSTVVEPDASHTILRSIHIQCVIRYSQLETIRTQFTHKKIGACHQPPVDHNVCRQSIFRRFKIRFYFLCSVWIRTITHWLRGAANTLESTNRECLYIVTYATQPQFSLICKPCGNHWMMLYKSEKKNKISSLQKRVMHVLGMRYMGNGWRKCDGWRECTHLIYIVGCASSFFNPLWFTGFNPSFAFAPQSIWQNETSIYSSRRSSLIIAGTGKRWPLLVYHIKGNENGLRLARKFRFSLSCYMFVCVLFQRCIHKI